MSDPIGYGGGYVGDVDDNAARVSMQADTIASLRAALQKTEAELLRCRTTEAVAAHQLDNLRVELGISIEHVAPVDAAREIRAKVAELRELQRRLAAVEEYAEHQSGCVLTYLEAGEPRADGYYQKYAGQWYRSDNPPQCTCGLYSLLYPAAAQSLARGERGEGK